MLIIFKKKYLFIEVIKRAIDRDPEQIKQHTIENDLC